ncbi:ABC transporter substrate-binding protein [Fibrella forsythiae]|uniref:Thiamine pyrimidine synthase n=1 Tax=Fibrella forsythiae TaxID=2817061 RepID=A0ABS3JCK0_9BACT|nr:ABC transporter substrate-binding protein [Fibrella forsythiae]MBO0947720.1 ABC transporter substrate-binding protein [Fibrella forsythiae]
MKNLRIALDWTANTNHTGFFVARELGFYADQAIELTLITPADDAYATTPAKKLELGQVDFALAPFESIISLHTKPKPVAVKAIAALLQEDLSAIVALASSHITRPGELDGRTYASYKARYEDSIIQQMIVNDGGKGDIQLQYPDKLGIWNTLLTNAADSTWIFDNWEGVEAETAGIQLTKFRLADYQIPYAYSPALMATQAAIEQNNALYNAFLSATKQGFLYAKANPEEAVDILRQVVPERDRQAIDLLKSQTYTAAYYGDESNWGKMDASRIQRFVDWLHEQGLENTPPDVQNLFTNELIE